jgi:hypothetical protein
MMLISSSLKKFQKIFYPKIKDRSSEGNLELLKFSTISTLYNVVGFQILSYVLFNVIADHGQWSTVSENDIRVGFFIDVCSTVSGFLNCEHNL